MSEALPGSDEELRQLLRQRKKRIRTSCYPCRTRKVKCNRGSPCENCTQRGYPELCTFNAEPNRRPRGLPSGSSTVSKDQSVERDARSKSHEPHGFSHQSPQSRSYQTVPPDASDSVAAPASPSVGLRYELHVIAGRQTPNSASGRRVNGRAITDEGEQQDTTEPFLGTDSMPQFLRDQAPLRGSSHDTPSSTIEKAIMPMLGLGQKKSTYPFLLGSQHSLQSAETDIQQAVPTDREVFR
jgi:hypothetical protein